MPGKRYACLLNFIIYDTELRQDDILYKFHQTRLKIMPLYRKQEILKVIVYLEFISCKFAQLQPIYKQTFTELLEIEQCYGPILLKNKN